MDEHELETTDLLISSKTHSLLTNHPLTQFIMRQSPLIVLSKIKAENWINDRSAMLETLDEYLRNPKHFNGICAFLAAESRSFYNLVVKIDKLQHVIYMIKFFPHRAKDNNLMMTQAEYIENVMEFYIVNSLGIQDRLYELVNLLYDLGVPKKALDRKKRIEAKLENVKLLKDLKLLDQVFSDIRRSRNSVVHEASYYSEDLENAFQQDLRFRELRDGADVTQDQKVEERAKGIDAMYDNFVADKMIDLYMNDSILTKILKSIFDELYKQHNEVLKSFGHKIQQVKGKARGNSPYDSLRKRSAVYSLNFDDVMKAVDDSFAVNPKNAGNAPRSRQ